MKDSETRKMFKTWVRCAMWHPYGVDEILQQETDGRFVSKDVEAQYEGYAAGIRKGIKIQKEKQKNASKVL